MHDEHGQGPARAIVVSFSGPDGSGKTTLANGVTACLREHGVPGYEVQRLWLRWNPKAKMAKRETDVESTLDSRHKGNLAKRVLTRIHLGSGWATAAERLYDYQLRLQLGAVPENQIIIADRYVPDFYADLVASGAILLEDVRSRSLRFPTTTISYLVDVSDAILLSRKAPQEDAGRMTARAALYRQLASKLDLEVIDPMVPGCESSIVERLIGMVNS
jgi:thymidylate kinase